MASTLIFFSFSFSSKASFDAGQIKLIRVLPSGAASISSAEGSRTLTMTSASLQSSTAVSTILTPAASYAASVIDAAAPAPLSTRQS